MRKTFNRVELVDIGVNEQVVWKQGKFDLFLLAVFPDPYGLDHWPEYLVIQIRKRLVYQTFGTGTQVKYMPFLLTCKTITGQAHLISANFIFPGVRQCKGF